MHQQKIYFLKLLFNQKKNCILNFTFQSQEKNIKGFDTVILINQFIGKRFHFQMAFFKHGQLGISITVS